MGQRPMYGPRTTAGPAHGAQAAPGRATSWARLALAMRGEPPPFDKHGPGWPMRWRWWGLGTLATSPKTCHPPPPTHHQSKRGAADAAPLLFWLFCVVSCFICYPTPRPANIHAKQPTPLMVIIIKINITKPISATSKPPQ